MVSKQICINSKDWAKAAYYCRNKQSRLDLLDELNDHRSFNLKDDEEYSEWHKIYYREMEGLMRVVWKNPNITEAMAIDITQTVCKKRLPDIKKRLEETNPKN